MAQTVVAIYFALFVSVIIPFHALICVPPGAASRHSLIASDSTTAHAAHNPELCQICRTHGQIDANITWLAVTAVDDNGANVTTPDQLATGLALVYVPSRRAPPSFS